VSEELRKCPFCEGEVESKEESWDSSDHGCDCHYTTTFACKKCGESKSFGSSKRDSIPLWNSEAVRNKIELDKDARIKELEGLLDRAIEQFVNYNTGRCRRCIAKDESEKGCGEGCESFLITKRFRELKEGK